MDTKMCQFSDMEIWARGDRFFVRYDAGAHQVVMREDEISDQEAIEGSSSEDAAAKLLFDLQKRLIRAGVNPYESNVK
ncbi:hypothetical protein [Pseudomonas sp. Marseille-P9899]|uniref:hypothetical protein n=1 Tax=Pseudomonas sp. Marseille-P9899 TaxID=2730401 RepID=UPI001589E599|nr:hypothetical protein [Pseudomonas sp. Marseille-P9899]